MGRFLILILFALLAVGLGALSCAQILGIEEKPLRTQGGAAADAPTSSDAGDGGQTLCADPDTLECSETCPHDFCDDFDRDGQAPASRWTAPAGFQNPFLQGDAGGGSVSTLALSSPGNNSPFGLVSMPRSTLPQGFSMLIQAMDFEARHKGKEIAGLRVSIDVLVDALTFTDVGGPISGVGSAGLLALLRGDSFPVKGVGVFLTKGSVHLAVSEDSLNLKGTQSVADINSALSVANVLNRWVRIELFVGEQARAKEKYAACDAVAPGLVVAATLGNGGLGAACLPIFESFGPTWIRTPALLVGGLLYAPGEATFRIDNVIADFQEK